MGYAIHSGGSLFAEAVEAFTDLMSSTGSRPSVADVERTMGLRRKGLAKLFRNDDQLLEAMAQNAMLLLHDQCIRTMSRVSAADPVTQFEALADAYVEWAYDHPREFNILGAMSDENFRANDDLVRYERGIRDLMHRILWRAQQEGLLDRDEDVGLLVLSIRAFAFGIIRMALARDMNRWTPSRDPLATSRAALHLFTYRILGVRRRGDGPSHG